MDKAFFIGLGLVVLIVTPILVYQYMSMKSYQGVTVKLLSVHRTVGVPPPPFTNTTCYCTTYYVETRVSSPGAFLSTTVSGLIFDLWIASPTQTWAATNNNVADGGTISGSKALNYNFTFVDWASYGEILYTSATQVTIVVSVYVTAGAWEGHVTKSDSSKVT